MTRVISLSFSSIEVKSGFPRCALPTHLAPPAAQPAGPPRAPSPSPLAPSPTCGGGPPSMTDLVSTPPAPSRRRCSRGVVLARRSAGRGGWTHGGAGCVSRPAMLRACHRAPQARAAPSAVLPPPPTTTSPHAPHGQAVRQAVGDPSQPSPGLTTDSPSTAGGTGTFITSSLFRRFSIIDQHPCAGWSPGPGPGPASRSLIATRIVNIPRWSLPT